MKNYAVKRDIEGLMLFGFDLKPNPSDE